MDLPETYLVPEKEFAKISTQETSEGLILVMPMIVHPSKDSGSFNFVLDGIRDPGNLGTILRTAAWLGSSDIICFNGCADCYNPKTVRASMGAIFSTAVKYESNFTQWLKEHQENTWVTMLNGISITETNLSERKYIIIGNESHGVSIDPHDYPKLQGISIPGSGKVESLNAGIAAGIIGWEWMSSNQKKS